MIYDSIDEMIGNTPLMELKNIEKAYSLKARILAKLEYFNPSGSVKDRVALEMINDAEASRRLAPGGTIIESTSGNTGIGICAVGVHRGYRVIIVMPENMSEERKKIITAYGGELVLTPVAEGVGGAVSKAQELHESIPGSIIAGQFVNEANPRAHFCTTGPEIYRDADGEVDYFIAGIGTGGTLTGTGRYLKSVRPSVKLIAVEPQGSAILSGGQDGPHVIEGIGDGFIPDVFDTELYDGVIAVSDDDALRLTRELSRTEGLFVGISSGANLAAALELARQPENEGKTIVALFADGGSRYFSTSLF